MSRLRGGVVTGFVVAIVLAPPCLAQSDVVLAPSAQPTGCVFGTGAKGLAPLPPGCAAQSVSGTPAITPDGQTLYLSGDPGQVLSRDPTTGALVPLTCGTPSGGSRCPGSHDQLLVAPDGRYLYVLVDGDINVLAREGDGSLSLAQCIRQAQERAQGSCDQMLPQNLSDVAMPSDGSAFYVAGEVASSTTDAQYGILLEFARDAATGRLARKDCLSEVDRTGCTTDPYLESPNIVAAVGEDVYVSTRTGMIGFRPYPPSGRLLENRCRGWVSTTPRCPTETGSPGDRPVVPSPDGRWLYGTNGGSIAAWPRDPATGLLGAVTCAGPWCRAPGGDLASLAVSPDGRTIVSTTAHNGTNYGNHDSGGRNLPGDGRESAVFTFRVADDGRVRYVGCVGNVAGCAGPFGDAVTAVYPPSGPGPYLLGKRDDQKRSGIQLLTEAPTVSFAPLTLKGPNPASVACPAGRLQACRGTVELSRLVYTHCCEGGAQNPTVRRLRRIRYQVVPGQSAAISLRIPAGARPGFHKIVALDHPYHGVNHLVGMLVKVSDATGLTTPTGQTVCLQKVPKGLECEY